MMILTKLDSAESKRKLQVYELAVKVLLAEDEAVDDIPGVQELTEEQVDELCEVILKIREDIGVEE